MDIFSDLLNIIFDFDEKFFNIVLLSLYISVLATILSSIVSIYVSSILVINDFIGRTYFTHCEFFDESTACCGWINSLYHILFFRRFRFFRNFIYTNDNGIAQFIIITPIVISLSYKSLQNRYTELYNI